MISLSSLRSFALLAVATACAVFVADVRGERYAFLVGVKTYGRSSGLNSLKYPEQDVEALAALLLKSGYRQENVRVLTQSRAIENPDLAPTYANIGAGLALLLRDLQAGDSVTVALAGHGVKFKNNPQSYFCPVDARIDPQNNLIPYDKLYDLLARSHATYKLLLADACRNDPFDLAARSVNSVTVPALPTPEGTVVALYSCSEGEKAWEEDEFGHGVFFHYVLEGLQGAADRKTGDLQGPANGNGIVELGELAAYTQTRVKDFVSNKRRARQLPTLRTDSSNFTLVTRFPVLDLRRPPQPGDKLTNSLGMQFARIPAGEFFMGSPDDEKDRDVDEHRHPVRITKPFYLGVHEVTVGQFREFVNAASYQTEAEKHGKGGSGLNDTAGKIEFDDPTYTWKNPGWPQTDEYPVVNVTWNDAQAFLQWLSRREGESYRLPTEAEWEYACRAGTQKRFFSGDDEADLRQVANVADVAFKSKFSAASWAVAWDDGYPIAAPVGRFQRNALGLFDMHGNVWEWCQDAYDQEYYATSPTDDPRGPVNPAADTARVFRGGSWFNNHRNARSADRSWNAPTSRDLYLGFRAARTP